MKIRALTLFLSFTTADTLETIKTRLQNASIVNSFLKSFLEEKGLCVQTTRVTTNSFEDYCDCTQQTEAFKRLSSICKISEDIGLDYFHIGNSKTIRGTKLIPDILSIHKKCSACTTIDSLDTEESSQLLSACVDTLIRISMIDNGFGCFSYTIDSRVKPFCPFFPGSYGDKTDSSVMKLVVATENGSFINKVIRESPAVAFQRIEEAYQHIENLVQSAIMEVNNQYSYSTVYQGIDTSVNPGNTSDSSIVTIIKTLRESAGDDTYVFGEGGSLASVRFLTKCVQNCHVQRVGYCGVMLPVLEDAELTRLWKENNYSSTMMLALSSVCGVGVDTYPLVDGASHPIRVRSIIEDVISLANKWDKPLSCRLFLVRKEDIHYILKRIEAIFQMLSVC